MLKFALSMLIPIWACIYTITFARTMHLRREFVAASTAYGLAMGSLLIAGYVGYKIFM